MDEQISAEERRIRRMGSGDASDSFDVKSSVMERVRAIHEERIASKPGAAGVLGQAVTGTEVQAPVMSRQQLPPGPPAAKRGKGLAAGLCAAALLGLAGLGVLQNAVDQETSGKEQRPDFAVTRQTDGEPLALKDSGGRVVAQLKSFVSKAYTPAYTGSASARERYGKLREQYELQAQESIQPGETAAYYVNDSELVSLMKGLGYGDPLFFTNKTIQYDNYDELLAAREQTGKWSFLLPPEAIGGFRFTQGWLFTNTPSAFEPQYQQVLGELKAKAEAAPDGNPLAITLWTLKDPARAELVYREGARQLTLNVSWDNTETTGPIQILVSTGQTAESWSFGGQELLFIAGATGGKELDGNAGSRLYWYDSAYGGLAWITDPPDQRLPREQWETIAAGMVQR
ncbi:hypothetical protein [Paenibacillus sp. MMS20-IR301]|uniref:hypothetical protein n=1 Tax=Paenibacillus sp. MMS20-IR301 TaxID=2895946 RepID=UPI0028E72AD3|nr:hypothetical protein [Paenibacillus sp. MMS20-IR301]WNS41238.1 hypothetical protein LOS79_19580 [Paenibacillus sp. MMS20-IR301]